LFACGLSFGVTCLGNYAIHAGFKLALAGALSDYRASDRGRPRMICSELATWAYHDAGADFDAAPWWPDIKETGVLAEPEAPFDFTTPNMISHSKDMDFVFQLKPEGPPAFIIGTQIRLGEQVTFDFGSAAVRP